MKKLIILASVLAAVCLCIIYAPRQAKSTPVTSVTFSIASSAATATPNLRINTMSKMLAKDLNGNLVQVFAPDNDPLNYYLTKDQTVTTSNYSAIQVQADQDTKMKINGSSTYYTLMGGVDYLFGIQHR